MNKDCFIIEDLLPLYNENLLSRETENWVENHLKSCVQCKELENVSAEPMTEKPISSPINYDNMMKKITFKLSLYQMIFIGISFFLALQTSLLNDSFGFILSYTVLGFITYLFYQNLKIVITIAFLPIFFWSLGTSFVLNKFFQLALGSLLTASIHLIFALIGVLIGYLVLKIKDSEGKK